MALLDDAYRAGISVHLDRSEVQPRKEVPGGRFLTGWIIVVLWAAVVASIVGGVRARDENGADSAEWDVRVGTESDLQLLRDASDAIGERSMRQVITLHVTSADGSLREGVPAEVTIRVETDGTGGAHFAIDNGTAAFSMVLDDDVAYLPVTDGEGWTGYRLTDFADIQTSQEQLIGAGVLSSLEELTQPEQVAVLGVEEIAGLSTTHYRAVLDFSAGSDIELDVWLDGLGIPRQLRYTQVKDGLTYAVEGTTTGIGDPIQVAVPTPDEVTRTVASTTTVATDPFPTHLNALLRASPVGVS